MKGQMLVFKPVTTRELTTEPPLDDIKAHLNGGCLEAVPGFTSINIEGHQFACVAYCDEDGKNKDLEFNSMATILWDKALRALNHPGLVTSAGRILDSLVGPVVVLAGDDEFMRSMSEDGD